MNTTHMIGVTSLPFFVNIFTTTHVMIPNMIPFAIEYVRGIIKVAMYALAVSATSSSNLIFITLENISIPT